MKQVLSRMFAPMLGAVLAACAATPPAGPDAGRPSIAQTESIEFLGKRFELKFEDMAGPTRIYEYFAGGESPQNWLELVEFQVYPVHPQANAPLDFAQRTAAALKQKYPGMQFGLYTVDGTDATVLDFFFPTSTRKEPGKQFLEFNVFKFFRDAGGKRTLAFHYARNVEATGATRTADDVIADLKAAREQVLPAMVRFPLYRQ